MTRAEHRIEAERLLANLAELSRQVASETVMRTDAQRRAHVMDIAVLIANRASIHARLAAVSDS